MLEQPRATDDGTLSSAAVHDTIKARLGLPVPQSPGGARFAVTPRGTILETGANYDLVNADQNRQGLPWLQIHGGHSHGGVTPHTHYPEVNRAGDLTSIKRRYKPTTARDADMLARMLQQDKMRFRRSRRDRGG